MTKLEPKADFVVLVCGGRDYSDRAQLEQELHNLIWGRGRFAGQPKPTKLIHGNARGADTMAGQFWLLTGLPCQAFTAQWAKHGPSAGPKRNQKMLDEGRPSLVIAFPGGAGTADMIDRATKAGVPVIIISRSNKELSSHV